MIYCRKQEIKQIFTSPSRQQTNGKIEKWFGTYERKRSLFETQIEFQELYNDTIHGNLG